MFPPCYGERPFQQVRGFNGRSAVGLACIVSKYVFKKIAVDRSPADQFKTRKLCQTNFNSSHFKKEFLYKLNSLPCNFYKFIICIAQYM